MADEINQIDDMEACMATKMEEGMSEEEAHEACLAMMEEEGNGKDRSKKDRAGLGSVERRFIATEACPVGIEERDGETFVTGYAAVFFVPDDASTEYQLFPDLKERIMSRAFNKALQEKHDAAALYNHDVNFLLGRVSSGTLRLSKDQRGLRYEVKPPTTRSDVVESIRRGDIRGSSFGFRVLDQKFRTEEGMDIREIHSVELLDVSPVVYPAYKGTSVGVRAIGDLEEIRAAHTAWKAEEARKAAIAETLAAVKSRKTQVEKLLTD